MPQARTRSCAGLVTVERRGYSPARLRAVVIESSGANPK
jgi:hypothetical protein